MTLEYKHPGGAKILNSLELAFQAVEAYSDRQEIAIKLNGFPLFMKSSTSTGYNRMTANDRASLRVITNESL